MKTDNVSIENLWTDDNRMVWEIIEVMIASTLLLLESSFFPIAIHSRECNVSIRVYWRLKNSVDI